GHVSFDERLRPQRRAPGSMDSRGTLASRDLPSRTVWAHAFNARLSDFHIYAALSNDPSAARKESVVSSATLSRPRQEAYGQEPLTWVDRFGVYLSKRAILRRLPRQTDLNVLDLGCGFQATLLRALQPYLNAGVGVDVSVSKEAKRCAQLAFLE